MQSRRRTLATVGSVLAGGAASGRALTLAPPSADPETNPDSVRGRATRTVDVSIFTVERLWRAPPGRDADERYRARLAKAALDRALPTLSDRRTSIDADVSIVDEPVPDEAVECGDAADALAAFDEYLDGGAADAAATDSNLLIAHGPGAGAAGIARTPTDADARRGDGTAAAVFDGLALGQNGPGAATGRRSGPYGRALSTVVHEVGHTLGLDHDDGTVWRDADDPSRAYVTPMRTGYYRADEGVRRIYTPYFNPDIGSRSLVGE